MIGIANKSILMPTLWVFQWLKIYIWRTSLVTNGTKTKHSRCSRWVVLLEQHLMYPVYPYSEDLFTKRKSADFQSKLTFLGNCRVVKITLLISQPLWNFACDPEDKLHARMQSFIAVGRWEVWFSLWKSADFRLVKRSPGGKTFI